MKSTKLKKIILEKNVHLFLYRKENGLGLNLNQSLVQRFGSSSSTFKLSKAYPTSMPGQARWGRNFRVVVLVTY